MDGNEERQPLLSPSVQSSAEAGCVPPTDANKVEALQWSYRQVVFCVALMLIFSFGSAIQVTPMSQLLEGILCQQLSKNGTSSSTVTVAGDFCKEPKVQSELSKVQAWMNTLEIVPGILVAAPYGALADRRGYRVVLTAASLGVLVQNACQMVIYSYPSIFPIRLLWATPIITLVGGGTAVLIPMLFAIVTAAVSEAQRSTAFFYLGAATQVGSLLSSPAAYLCMKVNVWLPVFIGFGCLGIATGICLVIPVAEHNVKPENTSSTRDSQGDDAHEEGRTLHRWLSHATQQTDAMFRWVGDHKSVTLFLITLLLTTLGKYASALEMQYISQRYKWSWSEAGLVLTSRSVTSLLLFTTVLPAAGNLLLFKGFTSISKDLCLARISLLLMAAGAVGVGLAPTIMGSMVAPIHTGLLYTIIAIFEALGTLTAGPLLAQVLNVGLAWGGRWIGLPFLATGLMYSASWLIIWPVGVPVDAERQDDD
ncbi:hypothetical protein NLU13_4662 [Sarocladium strictum]|uniref:Uncharacterized protein n=1 Tax=Sarocladium strictum TaxID=5046 RepID=A0AA39GJA9_SARSR|nr:hypothetical protein NLU13_4662 [Sarocladium strictum]